MPHNQSCRARQFLQQVSGSVGRKFAGIHAGQKQVAHVYSRRQHLLLHWTLLGFVRQWTTYYTNAVPWYVPEGTQRKKSFLEHFNVKGLNPFPKTH